MISNDHLYKMKAQLFINVFDFDTFSNLFCSIITCCKHVGSHLVQQLNVVLTLLASSQNFYNKSIMMFLTFAGQSFNI